MIRPWLSLTITVAAAAQDASEVDRNVSQVVRERYAEIRRCYDLALAKDGKLEGTVGVVLSIEPGGRVSRVRIDGDELDDDRMADCLARTLRTFVVDGFREAADVALPLRFEAPTQQFVVRTEDAPAHSILGGSGQARVLLDGKTVGARAAAVSRLTLRPGAKVPLHMHPEAVEVLYLLSGRGCMRGPSGQWKRVRAGQAVYIVAKSAHAFQASGTTPVEVIQIYVPGGPEQRFRDAKASSGTVAMRDAEVPPGLEPDIVPIAWQAGAPTDLFAVRKLALSAWEGQTDSLSTLALEAESFEGFVYVFDGAATLKRKGNDNLSVQKESAVYVPSRSQLSLETFGRTRVLLLWR